MRRSKRAWTTTSVGAATAEAAGVRWSTTGGVPWPAENENEYGADGAVPSHVFRLVPTVTVYCVNGSNASSGVSVTVLPAESSLAVTGIGSPSAEVTVKSDPSTVPGSSSRSKVTLTERFGCTLVAPLAGTVELTDGAPEGSTVIVPAGVVGWTPMSPRMFIVACWIRESASPAPWTLLASPRHQLIVPASNTSAPLAAV